MDFLSARPKVSAGGNDQSLIYFGVDVRTRPCSVFLGMKIKSPGPTCRVSSPTRNSPSPSITITIRLGVKFAALSRADRDVGSKLFRDDLG